MKRLVANGFALHERGDHPPVRHEWNGVYRIGFVDSKFRIIGFYEDGKGTTEFIAIDAFHKSGQGLSAKERARINEVARVKQEHDWRKVTDDGFPRLSQ